MARAESVRLDEPEIVKAKLAVLLRHRAAELKKLEFPDDIEEIVARYKAGQTAIRHARAQSKASFVRIAEKCPHKESKIFPAIPVPWQQVFAESGPRCGRCGVFIPMEADEPIIVTAAEPAKNKGGRPRKDAPVVPKPEPESKAHLRGCCGVCGQHVLTKGHAPTCSRNKVKPEPPPADVAPVVFETAVAPVEQLELKDPVAQAAIVQHEQEVTDLISGLAETFNTGVVDQALNAVLPIVDAIPRPAFDPSPPPPPVTSIPPELLTTDIVQPDFEIID